MFWCLLTAGPYVWVLTNCRSICFSAYQLQGYVFWCLPTAGPYVSVLTNSRAMCFGAYQLQAHVFWGLLTARPCVWVLTNCRPTCLGAYQLRAHASWCLPTAGPYVWVLTNCRPMCFGAYQLQAHVFWCKLHVSDGSTTVHQAGALQPVVLPCLLLPHCCRAVKWAGSQHLPKLRVSPRHSPHWATVCLVKQTKDKHFTSVFSLAKQFSSLCKCNHQHL